MVSLFLHKHYIYGWLMYIVIVGCLWIGALWGWFASKQHEKIQKEKRDRNEED